MASQYVKVRIGDVLKGRSSPHDMKMTLSDSADEATGAWKVLFWFKYGLMKTDLCFYSSDLRTMTCRVAGYPKVVEAMQKWEVPFEMVNDAGH